MMTGVVSEVGRNERRVALAPAAVGQLAKAGIEVIVQPGAGEEAGFPDEMFEARGASIARDRDEVFSKADVICQVWTATARPDESRDDLNRIRQRQTVIGLCNPLYEGKANPAVREMAQRGVNLFSLELLPRITRAQSMDVLSSQATIAGYKAVILAAEHLPKMFPMMMTAAGTIAAARVLVIGAGVAGLQAIATASRLGGVVLGYDIRPAVKEQVESLGAKFLELGLEQTQAEGEGGYAKAMDEEFYRKQRKLLGEALREIDVLITTAAIPGRKSPMLVTADMVRGMTTRSVIVDLAAERGGNCELTEADETVTEHGVTIIGPTNLPATVPHHASQMFGRNMAAFLLNIYKDGELSLDTDDEIIRDTLLVRSGELVNPHLAESAPAT